MLFIQENITVALGFTLLHSLWEGAGLAFFAGLVLVFTRRSGASVRYNLLGGALALFVAVVFFTFLYEVGQATVLHGSQADSFGGSWAGSRISGWIGDHAGIVAAIWLVVICLKLIRLSFDLYTLQRLKMVRIKPLDVDLLQRVHMLADGLGISKVIRVLESGIVKAPLVIGYIRPVILIPAGLIAKMAPEDLEAILIHELAHIRRADYLINIFLRIVSILLFFNPAVLWVSSLIRAERENCCDDMVIRHTGDRLDYIRALVRFEEHRAPSYAMAFGGGGRILPRVERLAAGYSRTLNKVELFVLSALLVLTCFFAGLRPSFYRGQVAPGQVHISTRAGTLTPDGSHDPPPEGSQPAAMEAKLKAEAAARAGHP